MKSHQYTQERILEILTILQSNNFNILKTSEQTKIRRGTISKWLKKYRYGIPHDPPIIPALIEEIKAKENDLAVVEEDTMGKYQDELLLARIEMLRQLRKVIPTCYNVKTAADAMKIINDINTDITNSQEGKPPEINVFQNIMNNIENLSIKNLKHKKE
jgi:hypothetical protein